MWFTFFWLLNFFLNIITMNINIIIIIIINTKIINIIITITWTFTISIMTPFKNNNIITLIFIPFSRFCPSFPFFN